MRRTLTLRTRQYLTTVFVAALLAASAGVAIWSVNAIGQSLSRSREDAGVAIGAAEREAVALRSRLGGEGIGSADPAAASALQLRETSDRLASEAAGQLTQYKARMD